MTIKYKQLSEVAQFSNEKISLNNININNYISTENMIPNKGGITTATNLPDADKVRRYEKGNILLSNIRPYFKKIWYSNKKGGCSNDVLVLETNPEIESEYLYYILSSNDFFDYVTSTSKGTKMPRGDKSAIMQYDIPIYTLEDQKRISKLLSTIDKKIDTNTEINNNSVLLGDICKYLRFGVVISGKQKELISTEIKKDSSKPYLEGKEIDQYTINSKGNYIEYIPKKIHRPRTEDLFESKKIMIQCITGGNTPLKATYDNKSFYNKESIINLVLKENSSYDYNYILALINSNLINWYYTKEFTNESILTVNLSKEYLSTIPIKNISYEEQVPLINLAEKMLTLNLDLKKSNTPTERGLIQQTLENTNDNINKLVYELYNLTKEEIKLIENR